MLQDSHEGKTSIPVTASATGDNIIIANQPNAWIYVHEVIGDLSNSGTMIILAGARELAKFELDAGQGNTVQDLPGDDGNARFKCKPGEDFIFNLTAGTIFKGSVVYSFRY